MKVWSAIFYKYIVKILWKKLRICVILKNKDSEVIMMINIRKLESELWESADLLRSSSKQILKDRPSRGGRILPVEASDFKERSALFLPKEAQYDYLLNLPGDIASADIKNINGEKMNSLGEVVNNAMQLVEDQSELLKGVLPKDYTIFSDELLSDLLCIFNNSALNDVGGDVIGRIYEYFLNKFAKNIASDDGVFFTPKSLVKMIVNVIEPKKGILLDPACGSGGMFIQSGDFVTAAGKNANSAMSFYGQEKVEYNAQLCLMNMAVHGLSGRIRSGDEANTFYHDAYNLCGKCDYVMANPPFNVDKVKSESCTSAGRLPFGQPAVNKSKEFGNANYLWISYFYAYLNEHGRAGFVMASSATDSQSKDKDIREKLIKTGHVDVMVSVGNNFFYTKSLQCSLWFFDKNKSEAIRNKVLFIDTRNYYTVIDRTLNEWSEWQLKNLNAIVWLYRGEIENYQSLIQEYKDTIYRYTYESTDKELDDILSNYGSFSELSEKLSKYAEQQRQKANQCVEQAAKKNKKSEQSKWDNYLNYINEIITTASDAEWLYEKFGEGEYRDIAGLCKVASLDDIESKNWSLTPGAYVGVAPVEDDGVDFASRMKEIHAELVVLQQQSNELMDIISKNMEEMGL